MYMYVCLCVVVVVCVWGGGDYVHIVQKPVEARGSPVLDLQEVVSCTTWVLGTELLIAESHLQHPKHEF